MTDANERYCCDWCLKPIVGEKPYWKIPYWWDESIYRRKPYHRKCVIAEREAAEYERKMGYPLY